MEATKRTALYIDAMTSKLQTFVRGKTAALTICRRALERMNRSHTVVGAGPRRGSKISVVWRAYAKLAEAGAQLFGESAAIAVLEQAGKPWQ